MALSKIQSESINLADDFTFTGTVAGAGGITVADQWRLTASTSFVTDTYTNITANWERNDSTGFGYIGTGMTQSSGVFTFPSTGYYLINAVGSFQQNSNGYSYANSLGIKTTINNSTYTIQTSTFTFGESKAPGVHNDSSSEFIFDVTSTANCKVMFAHFGTNGIVRGSTSENTTHVTFIRLGDT
mgnify:CR=1 FL=1|tara:strand:- start:323 stop:877 length:555 start_codon:yes stop_codon:yes gene_type:complete